MNRDVLARKAEAFRALHDAPKLLLLPNIWDPLGARLLEKLGYPAVATASAAVAFSLGYDDGERISFEAMLGVIRCIAGSVEVPVSADIERGYAQDADAVAERVREVLEAGAVGINLEDSLDDGSLRSVDAQCARIRAVRAMAHSQGVPLLINARTDVFMLGPAAPHAEKMLEAIVRAKAYLDAGADCIYPITLEDLDALRRMRAETGAALNVYASATTPALRELEAAGISRLSIGPGLIRASFTSMQRIARELLHYGGYDAFTTNAVPSDEIRKYVSKERMEEGN
ncbi:MAG: isocitrate lyase/phosphoenolpyruvate mutase family protein [Candidatus Latescibacterota bacterium]|nr:MAG: isocitrate lyase/phosphoenolpyruvate mutase family protein [Candidatus Latescibacterota bacterium]